MRRTRSGPRIWIISRHSLWLAACACAVIATIPLRGAGISAGYGLEGGPESVAIPATAPDALRSELERVAAQFDRPPVSARLDPVWKMIPELNGVQLDIPATLRSAGTHGDVHLIFAQIAPQVRMADLVAAPIYRGNPGKRQMALMFNVAWGTEYVPEILAILKSHGVRATFFLDGSWTKGHPSVAREIAKAGMEIGNHAFNHPMMSRIGRLSAISQIERANTVIEQATGHKPALFAPPAGDFNETTVAIAAGLHMKTILWTLDTVDWRRPPVRTILNRIVPRREPGALVLMHPTAPTVAALGPMIVALQKDGYVLVTVSQLIDPERPVPATLSAALSQMRG